MSPLYFAFVPLLRLVCMVLLGGYLVPEHKMNDAFSVLFETYQVHRLRKIVRHYFHIDSRHGNAAM